jgi:hypothetical protein
MGNCGSSNDKNVGTTNMTGPGLPPQQIIPQPVEVTNIDHTLAEKISAPPVDNLQTATSQNIINNSINNQISPQMNQVNSIPNTINEINTSLDNNNLPVNNTFNQGQSMNINNNNFIGSSQNGLNNTINNNSQMISQQPMTNYSLKGNDFNLGSRYSNGKERRRMYIVVQLPGREIEITKLYEDNSLSDIEPFIAPDTIDEFDFYNSQNYTLDDLIDRPFSEWHNIYKTLRIKLIRSGLHIPNEVRKYIAKRTYLIGGLTFDKPNSFGLFIFNKMNNSTLSFEYSTNIYIQMRTVNQFSAYCNALNKLYISGGEPANNQITDTFMSIDLNEVQQNIFVPTQLCNLRKKRYWHSMIFIPEKYIFIIGGPNELDVELYDIDKNVCVIDSRLNTDRCEPSLILVNEKYLYTFFGFHLYESFINSIERCNINRKHRQWEMVNYKLSNTPNLAKAFFGVSYVGNNILLLSDKENQNDLKPNYLLVPGQTNCDTIYDEGILNSKSTRLFGEKFFIPFTEEESINLAFKSGEPKIFIVNNINGAINELCLNESQ